MTITLEPRTLDLPRSGAAQTDALAQPATAMRRDEEEDAATRREQSERCGATRWEIRTELTPSWHDAC